MDSKKDCKICREGDSLSGGSCKRDPQSSSIDTTPSSVGDSSTGGIIGAVVGVIVLIVFVSIVVVVVVMRQRKQRQPAAKTMTPNVGQSQISPAASMQPQPPQQQVFSVTLPPGAAPGQQVQVPSPDGQLIQFVVPDVAPGNVISVPFTPLGM
jgi:hypothetical protein